MKLYHGTNKDFDKIDLLKSKPNEDFGRGFYLSEEWAKFILLNRNNSTDLPAHEYDVVIGPIANDRVGVQLWKYENRSIDLPTLVRNLQYMKGVTIQYFFSTERAIKLLQRL